MIDRNDPPTLAEFLGEMWEEFMDDSGWYPPGFQKALGVATVFLLLAAWPYSLPGIVAIVFITLGVWYQERCWARRE